MGLNSCNKSEHQKRKALTIFQIACCNINKGTIKTPLHLVMGRQYMKLASLLNSHVPTYLACLRAYVPTCLACFACQRALRALRGYVLTCYNYK